MSEENIYAPPTADIDEENSTKYLEHDGYSEDCMLLCNEHFKSPKICIKTGEDLRQFNPPLEPKLLVIGRYLPSLKESILVQGAWFIRIIFVALAIFTISSAMENMPSGVIIGPILACMIFLYFIHSCLNFCSATTIKIPLYLSPSYAKKRRKYFNFWLSLLAVCVLMIVLAIFTNEIPPILILLSVLGSCLSLAIIMYSLPLFTMKFRRGDYYYVSGVHPYFLAALPLRK